MPDLQQVIGYSFTDKRLLKVALTHPSISGESEEEHNQRLEFLGDAVLQLTMSERLYRGHPKLMEGELSRMRARSVKESALCEAARRVGLGEHLRMSHGEEQSGGRDRPSVLADAMEAVLGAVYLDGGIEAARGVVERCLPTVPEQVARDYKSELQERLQLETGKTPSYRIAGEEGPPHSRIFVAEAILEDAVVGSGEGTSKKSAEQSAARDALEKMHGGGRR